MLRTLFILVLFHLGFSSSFPQQQKEFALEDQAFARSEQFTNQFTNLNQFYPSFAPFQAPPLGHSRPYFNNQETAYSHRSNAYANNFDSSPKYSGFKDDSSSSLLGSGNFGVIRGGTFYNDNEKDKDDYSFGNNFGFGFQQNGHQRPFYNNKPTKYQQFENFRDFADINVPTNPAYSQYVVVYANKNKEVGDEANVNAKPKNIIEHLNSLDDDTNEFDKLSKTKRKLMKVKVKKTKVKVKKSLVKDDNSNVSNSGSSFRDFDEPLLALS